MLVSRIQLRQFRSLIDFWASFGPGVNVIGGGNGVGKTSVLEAIYVAIYGYSFRTHQLRETIHRLAGAASIELLYDAYGVEQQLRLKIAPKGVMGRDREDGMRSSLPLVAVAVTPGAIALVQEGPQQRRLFLDHVAVQMDPFYAHQSKRYLRCLRQRNALLRGHAPAGSSLDPWDLELARLASYLQRSREKLIGELAVSGQRIYGEAFSSFGRMGIRYRPSGPFSVMAACSENDLIEAWVALWRRQRVRDAALGFTFAGPHKDDFQVDLEGVGSRQYASEGEQRCCAMTVKLAAWEQIHMRFDGCWPLLLLDDMTLGLDMNRQGRFFDYLKGKGQVFITTTQSSSIGIGEGVTFLSMSSPQSSDVYE